MRPKRLQGRIVTPQFKERKDGAYKMIGLYAKRARGLMSRYIIQNRILDPDEIKAFDIGGYAFDPGLSSRDEWVFTRG